MKDFNYPDREWANVTEDRGAEIMGFDAMPTTSEVWVWVFLPPKWQII